MQGSHSEKCGMEKREKKKGVQFEEMKRESDVQNIIFEGVVKEFGEKEMIGMTSHFVCW